MTMPRGGATQVRTFNYDLTTGRLMSATNPENGTVSYTYNADGTVATRTDAKAQRTEYTYDTHQRVSQVKRFAGGVERTCERVDYTYEANGSGFSASWGGPACTPQRTFTAKYTYGTGGRLKYNGVTLRNATGTTRQAGATYRWNVQGSVDSVEHHVPKRYWDEALQEYSYLTDSFHYEYDEIGRPTKMRRWSVEMGPEWPAGQWDYIKDVTYGGPGELTGMKYVSGRVYHPGSEPYYTYNWYTETRAYNALRQLTRLTAEPDTALPRLDLEYRYTAGQNNGRIAQMKDWVTGEEISYQYDSLNRLVSAATTGPEWGLGFAYDGFGNLTNQAVTKGSAPALAVAVDPATNRIASAGFSYDANGNLTATPGLTLGYDTANRMKSAGAEKYAYDPLNRKVWAQKADGEYLYVYGPGGELMAEVRIYWSGSNEYKPVEYVYFGGRQVMQIIDADPDENDVVTVLTDRLGSGRSEGNYASSYYPYGETRSGAGKMYATYPKSATGLNYAMNRWYSSQVGRFTTPDPYQASAGPANPQSWNRYAYVENDPVNYTDRSGLNRDVCADAEMATDSYCAYLRGQSGYWSIGIGSYWNGEYWTKYPVSVWVPRPTPGGGSRSGSLQDRELLPAAHSRALQALSLNKDCLNLFGNEKTRANGFDPSAVLTSLATGGKFGSIQFADKGPDWGVAKVTSALPKVSQRVTLTINSYNDADHLYWNDALTDYNAHTLLHELGHAYDSIRGSGNSVIKSPDTLFGDSRSRWNDWRIDQDCFGGSLGFREP